MTHDLADADDYPFQRFADDRGEYRKSRLFWTEAFAGTLGSEAGRWRPWIDDPFSDGHPIFSAIDATRTRAVLLQQVLKEDDPVWFKCWMSTSGDADEGRVEFLFVETFVSAPGRALFQDLVAAWCREHRDFAALERSTDEIRRGAADRFDDIDFGWPATGTPDEDGGVGRPHPPRNAR